MRVGWLSDQWPQADDAPAREGLLPGRYPGGAEMLQDLMRQRAPVEVVEVNSRKSWDALDDCDRVVCASINGLTPVQRLKLEPLEPVLWLMSPVHPHSARLLSAARLVVWASEGLRQDAGFGPEGIICPGWWDTTQVPRGIPKQDFALWAHRDHPQKGERLARRWAEENEVELVVLKNRPRLDVLEHMGRARWFVALAENTFDPCPTSVIEAEIAGCEIVANDLVGRTPVRGADENAAYIDGLDDMFWGAVCS